MTYANKKHRHNIEDTNALRVELDILHNEYLALASKVKEWIKIQESR